MATATCPTRDMLLQYSIGTLSDEQSDDLAGHLDSCPDCQATIVTLEDAEDTLIGRLRMPLGSEPCLAEPEFQAALAEAIAIPGAAGKPSSTGVSPVVGATGVSPVPSGDEGNPASAMPHMLGEYQILEELGRGGMGRVYKALHTKLDRVVAVKVLPRGRLEDPQAIARFEREMKAVGRLAHPNIVQAYDAREIDGTPVLVMEFVDGLDLAELVRRVGPLPVAEACELVRQTALGLQRAHEHGLVHRDIKPSNLMLTGLPSPVRGRGAGGEGSQPQVKILDLGLALLKGDQPGDLAPATPHAPLQSPIPNPQSPSSPPATHHPPPADDLTGADQIMGTASYMAPEQAGDAHQVDIRADIYSLGCTLYKLLSGHAPGGLARTTHHPPPATQVRPIRQLRPEVPEELAAVLARMLAKDPADRFATPAEVAEALGPFTAGHDLASLLTESPRHPLTPSSSHPVTPSPRHPFIPRRRLALAAGGAAAAILFGIVFLVSTGKGTVKLEFADAEAARQCTISIDGDAIRIENLGEPIKLRPGKHQLRILHGGLEIETREFDVVRNGAHVLHVSIPEAYAPGAKGESEISDLQDCAADLLKFCEANPKHYGAHRELFDTYYKLGELLYSRGRTAEAKAAFENAYQHGFAFIELRPDNEPQSEASCRRLVVNLMSDCPIAEVRNPDKLIELAKQADAMEPGMNSFLSLGLAYYRAGQWRQAVANLEEWSRRYAGPANSYRGYFLAMAYWHLGRKDEARRCFHEVDGRYVVPASRPTASRYRAEAAQLLGIPDVPGAEPPRTAEQRAPAKIFVASGSGGLNRAIGLAFSPDNKYLLVSSFNSNQVMRYDAVTGAPRGMSGQRGDAVFVTWGLGGLVRPEYLRFGPDGNLYVVSSGTNQVFRYNGQTGALVDIFVKAANNGGLRRPVGLTFDAKGYLYVSGAGSGNVVQFDTSGNPKVFVPAQSGGLKAPEGMLFAPAAKAGSNQDFYVASAGSHEILRYDGETGAYIGVFVPAGMGGLRHPQGIILGPDGNLCVSTTDNGGRVIRFDRQTGKFIDAFPALDATRPTDLAWGPDGALYVSTERQSSVMRISVPAAKKELAAGKKR